MLTALYLFAIVLLVLANGFFVAAEFALVGLRRSRIETLAAENANVAGPTRSNGAGRATGLRGGTRS